LEIVNIIFLMADYHQPKHQPDNYYERLDNDEEAPQDPPYPGTAGLHPTGHVQNKSLFENHFMSEMSEVDEFWINHRNARNDFITKVYGIITAQLAMTAVIVLLAVFTPFFGSFLLYNTWFFIVCIVGTIVTELVLICIPNFARTVPRNYICLFVFTFFESMVVSYICVSVNDPFLVFVAAVMTCAIVGALTAYAFLTKSDFSAFGSVIWTFLAALLIMGLMMIIFRSRLMHIMYWAVAVFIFGFVLIVDTQMIKGGGQYSMSEEDYIIAALMIYLDIVTIFIQLLQLLASWRGD
jgi:FtsH-binding integral membrane protein